MSLSKKQYSRELIERYRGQEFQRDVVESVPFDLVLDEATLSCGHKQLFLPPLVRTAGRPQHKVECQACAKAWLAKEGNESEQG